MAESIYESIYGAGSTAGEYQASLYSAAGEKKMIDIAQQSGAQKQQDINQMVSNLTSLLAVGSELYGGWKDKQTFEHRTLPKMQKFVGKKAWSEMSSEKKFETARGLGVPMPQLIEDIKLGDLSESVQSKWFEKFKITEEEQSWGDWATGQDKTYTFGEGKDAPVLTKGEIQTVDLYSKYGMGGDINLDDFLKKEDETPLPTLGQSVWDEVKGIFE